MSRRSSTSPWQPLRQDAPETTDELPGKKGTWVLFLEPPLIQPSAGGGRCVLFSWQGGSFKIRDFINKTWRRQGEDLPRAQDVWAKAKRRIACHGELRQSIDDAEFWTATLTALTDQVRAELRTRT